MDIQLTIMVTFALVLAVTGRELVWNAKPENVYTYARFCEVLKHYCMFELIFYTADAGIVCHIRPL